MMGMYSWLLKQIKKRVSHRSWIALSNKAVNGFLGIALFFLIFAFVRLIWWGGSDNFALYTGFDGTYNPSPIAEFINLKEINRFLSEATAVGIDFFAHDIFQMDTKRIDHFVFALRDGVAVSGIEIYASCAGNRELLIILLVMLIIPGPTKPRLWVIPSVIALFYIINSARLAGVLWVGRDYHSYFWEVHDYSGNLMSVLIFFIWLFWEKRYAEQYRLDAWKRVNLM